MRRSAIDRPRVLNDAGARLIGDAFARRSRKQCSWGDCAEIIVLTLDATGQLRHYTQPEVDPLATIQTYNEMGARDGHRSGRRCHVSPPRTLVLSGGMAYDARCAM